MRNHLTFISTVAPVALIIGFGLVVIEADEAQASLSGKAGLNLWGNIWFLLGLCLVIVGSAGIAIAITIYTRELRQESKDELRAGRRLSVGQSVRSPNGRFQLKLQEDGNLVAYLADNEGQVWSAGTGGTGGSNYLKMQKDGNLVLYAKRGEPLWATGTGGQGGRCLMLQDDGSLVIYARGGEPVWASGTVTA